MKGIVKQITPKSLKAALHDGNEIALLDAREEVPFDACHLLMASCVPLGRLETLVADLVPRRSTRVVWCDAAERDSAGRGLAERAAARMSALGYSDVSVLDGGIDAWQASGQRVYSGVHVPSKAFAEVVEHQCSTPHITAQELKALIDSKANIAIYDTRSYDEYHSNSIPGAISVPGAEIVYRFKDLTPSPETLVVVNCGGRTRSIIGAQALINARVPNKVVSLKNGTQDWHLAGYEVVKGATRRPPEVSSEGLQLARDGAERVARLCGIQSIDRATLDAWQGQSGTRTVYMIDVRTPEEFETGHIPGVKHVAGGQLVQETDRHLAVWGARVVLFDEDGVRATLTASWLKQMGWDVATMRNEAAGGATESGRHICKTLGLDRDAVTYIEVHELKKRLDEGTLSVVDLDYSRNYYDSHIPGAWFALRSRLDTDLHSLTEDRCIVFTCPDGKLASLAACEFDRHGISVMALHGGTAAWRAAGLPLQQGPSHMASAAEDIRLRAREQGSDIEAAMRAYLEWEINLVNDMDNDDDHRFKVIVPSPNV